MENTFLPFFDALSAIVRKLKAAEADRRDLMKELQALRSAGEAVAVQWSVFDNAVGGLLNSLAQSGEPPQTQSAGLDETPESGDDPELNAFLADEGGAARFRRGLGYFELLMFADSALEFESILRLAPNLHAARLYLALSYLGRDRFDDADRHLNHLLASAKSTAILAAAHDAKGQLYARQERFKEAETSLRRVLSLRPQDADTWFNLAVCRYERRKFRLAAAAARQAARLAPTDAEAWRLLGASVFGLGDSGTAVRAYGRSLSLKPSAAETRVEFAMILRRLRAYERAEKAYRRLLGDRLCVYEALGGLAEIALSRGQHDLAAARFKQQACLRPDHPDPLERLGWALIGGGDARRAEKSFLFFIRRCGASADALLGLSRAAEDSGDLRTARRILSKIVQNASPAMRSAALAELARLQAALGRKKTARRLLQAALAADPLQPDALRYQERLDEAALPGPGLEVDTGPNLPDTGHS